MKEIEKIEILESLKMPFPVSSVRWRLGATNSKKNNGVATKGIPLAYVDARDVMKRLDDVCGSRWQCKYTHVTSHGVVCDIGVKIGDEWVWRANGAGETQVEGEKGAMSDAFKRAAVLFGVARYLYYLGNVWVDVNQGKFLHPKLPDWATPDGYRKSQYSRKVMKESVDKVIVCLADGDRAGVLEIIDEMDNEEKVVFYGKLNSQERTAITNYQQEEV